MKPNISEIGLGGGGALSVSLGSWAVKMKFSINKFHETLTSCAPPNQADELECRHMVCSPAVCDVKVNRPSAAYVYKKHDKNAKLV